MSTTGLHPDEMPAPEALVNYPDGSVGPAMFHYLASEDHEAYERVLQEHDFEVTGHHLSEDDPLFKLYEEDLKRLLIIWNPPIPLGWKLGGKHDTEDGPYVFFLKRKSATN